MSTTETNKANAIAFYRKAFTEHKPDEAVATYVGDKYVQQNPEAADSTQAFVDFVKALIETNPGLRNDLKQALAEGDLVMVHVHIITGDKKPGLAAVTTNDREHGVRAIDLFRFESGKIVEHWDVVQPIPPTSSNANGMF